MCHLGENISAGLKLALLSIFLLAGPTSATNACLAEMASACPERPGSEMARCLKNKEEHEAPTTISSECTDFIALNVACKDEIAKFCDESFFTDDTVLCLSEWTPRQNLGGKCSSVVEWAAPQKDGASVTDELGLSEDDYAEKKKWQAERKAGRGAAIEKMRGDKKQEQELETMKKEDPEGYKLLMKEQAEAKKSFEDLKRRKRLLAAAEERKRKEEMGEEEDVPEEESGESAGNKKGKRRRKTEAKKGSWLPYVLGGCGGAFVLFNILNFFSKDKDAEKSD